MSRRTLIAISLCVHAAGAALPGVAGAAPCYVGLVTPLYCYDDWRVCVTPGKGTWQGGNETYGFLPARVGSPHYATSFMVGDRLVFRVDFGCRDSRFARIPLPELMKMPLEEERKLRQLDAADVKELTRTFPWEAVWLKVLLGPVDEVPSTPMDLGYSFQPGPALAVDTAGLPPGYYNLQARVLREVAERHRADLRGGGAAFWLEAGEGPEAVKERQTRRFYAAWEEAGSGHGEASVWNRRAIEAGERLLELAPEAWRVSWLLASTYQGIGDAERAREAIRRAWEGMKAGASLLGYGYGRVAGGPQVYEMVRDDYRALWGQPPEDAAEVIASIEATPLEERREAAKQALAEICARQRADFPGLRPEVWLCAFSGMRYEDWKQRIEGPTPTPTPAGPIWTPAGQWTGTVKPDVPPEGDPPAP